jgi:porin
MLREYRNSFWIMNISYKISKSFLLGSLLLFGWAYCYALPDSLSFLHAGNYHGLDVSTGEGTAVGVLSSVPEENPSISSESDRLGVEGSKTDFWNATSLSGDWNGGRNWLRERGIDFSVEWISDGFDNLHGGVEQKGAYIQNINFASSVDAGKMFGWDGGSMFVHVLSNNGGGLNRYVGDVQGVSNIEAYPTTKLYQAWVQQDLMHGNVSLLLGLYDLNTEFYATGTSGLFLNSSHGIGKDFSQSGVGGPSIYPNTSTGLRVRVLPYGSFYIQAVVLDGVPGDPNNPDVMKIYFTQDEGALITTEAGYSFGNDAGSAEGLLKVAFGFWKYTSQFDRLDAVDENNETLHSSSNWGTYAIAEKSIYSEPVVNGQGINCFVKLGYANSAINQFDYNLCAGLVYTGIIPGRDDDQLGAGIAHLHNGAEYIGSMNQIVFNSETTLELIYKVQIAPWLMVQPDIQYVVHPGTDVQISNAFVVGSRFGLNL